MDPKRVKAQRPVPVRPGAQVVMSVCHLQTLITRLQQRRLTVVGPTRRDGAIVYDVLRSANDLPAGWTDEHSPGRYALKPRDDQALFGYVVGPHSWKQFLFPARLRLWSATKTKTGWRVAASSEPAPTYAFLGVRPCEVAAMKIQDRVFLGEAHQDPAYNARRKQAFIIAVNCTQAGGTCFCASMGTGPSVSSGFDLALTELLDGGEHRFVVAVGTVAGGRLMAAIPHRAETVKDQEEARARVAEAAGQMGRQMDTSGLKDLLYRNGEHPRWDEVAARCLSCANCTMVCPTCFCSTVEEVSDLTGTHAQRRRTWDSCFTGAFSYIHGGSVRASTKSRYRQWLTHKLATWIDQFGSSGCVGCGRCITWCPAGIDITEEVRAIRATAGAGSRQPEREPTHAGT